MGAFCYNIGTIDRNTAERRSTQMHGIKWEDIRGLFVRLSTAKQEEFIDYLRSLQDIEDSSMPQPCDFQEDSEKTA